MQLQGSLQNNAFFHSDVARVLDDMTDSGRGHGRTKVHPLFVLFTRPITDGLHYLGVPPITSALLLNSLAGAACVACAFWLFTRLGMSLVRATLGGVFLGFTTTHLYFGSAPETFIFSALSLVLLFTCVAARQTTWRSFLPAALFSFGVLITNFALVLITYAAASVRHLRLAPATLRTLLLGLLLLVITTALALLQEAIYHRTTYFFWPSRLASEKRFSPKLNSVAALAQREAQLARHTAVFSFFAPETSLRKRYRGRMMLQFKPGSFSQPKVLSYAALVLWFTALSAAGYAGFRARLYRDPFMLAIIGTLAFQAFLHTVYGDDLFLYTCNTCFLLLLWLLYSFRDVTRVGLNRSIDAVLVLLVVLEIANNLPFLEALRTIRVIPI